MNDRPDDHDLFACTFGAAFAVERRDKQRALVRPLDIDELKACAHEAITAARGALLGLRELEKAGEPG